MTAYIVEGENSIFGSVSRPIDDMKIIKEDNTWMKMFKRTPVGNVYDLIESFFDHSIDTVIESLQ